mmetsp:Transcript_22752/g.53090  ORF Transcript_22752/g.53090 Transcript_22752/m.53090 type:complete len:222 (-) Transcript_22752:516-1181(-)
MVHGCYGSCTSLAGRSSAASPRGSKCSSMASPSITRVPSLDNVFHPVRDSIFSCSAASRLIRCGGPIIMVDAHGPCTLSFAEDSIARPSPGRCCASSEGADMDVVAPAIMVFTTFREIVRLPRSAPAATFSVAVASRPSLLTKGHSSISAPLRTFFRSQSPSAKCRRLLPFFASRTRVAGAGGKRMAKRPPSLPAWTAGNKSLSADARLATKAGPKQRPSW